MSAPVKFDPEKVWPIIFEKMAAGASLSSIVQLPGMPSYTYCKAVLRENEALRREYEAAQEARADFLAEEIERLADEEIPEGLDGPSKSAWIQRQRLRVDTRKWSAAKMRPRVYSDHLALSLTDERISILGALDEARLRTIERQPIEGEVVASEPASDCGE